jgi:hypothetical protein
MREVSWCGNERCSACNDAMCNMYCMLNKVKVESPPTQLTVNQAAGVAANAKVRFTATSLVRLTAAPVILCCYTQCTKQSSLHPCGTGVVNSTRPVLKVCSQPHDSENLAQ